jgi:putative salt-induced outer membrane protein YdiY
LTTLPFLLAAFVATQAPPPDAAGAAERAAAAAEKAAQAAAIAAEAALRAAEAAARISATIPARFEVPATPAVPAAAVAAAARPPSPWTGTVGLGFVSLTGNSRTVTLNATAAAERKTEGWILGTKLHAAYGQNRAAATGATETVASAAGALLRLDRRYGPRYSTYLLGAADTDRVKSLALRSTGEAGASIVWVDAGGAAGWKTSLSTDLGFRVAYEQRSQYYPTRLGLPDEMLYAPRAGIALRYALSGDVLFAEDAEILPSVVGEGRVVVGSVSKISTRLSRSLAFGVAFTVAHDSRPAPEKVSTDTSLALTLDVLL